MCASADGCGREHHNAAASGREPSRPEIVWLPELDDEDRDASLAPNSTLIMPIFPNQPSHHLCVFSTAQVIYVYEPRYIRMVEDVLRDGSRTFVVTMTHPQTGQLARTGVLFRIDAVQVLEGEQTRDEIVQFMAALGSPVKYACSHTVIGRVAIERVLNPHALDARETYLRAHVTRLREPLAPKPTAAPRVIARTEKLRVLELKAALRARGLSTGGLKAVLLERLRVHLAAHASAVSSAAMRTRVLEAQLAAALSRLATLQAAADGARTPCVAAARAAPRTFNVTATPEDEALWRTIGKWFELQDRRISIPLAAVERRLAGDVSRRIAGYAPSLPELLSGQLDDLRELPADVVADLAQILERCRVQIEELRDEARRAGEALQLLLQADGHDARLALFTAMVTREADREADRLAERARLARSLNRLFNRS